MKTLAALPGLEKTSPLFRALVVRAGEATGYPADEIAAVMYSESKFAPDIVNTIGATGLIQFMPETAKRLGTTAADLAGMSREEQMRFVEKFYAMPGTPKWKLPGDTYVRTFLPAAVGRADDFVLGKRDSDEPSLQPGVSLGKMFAQNPGLASGDVITVGSVRQKILRPLAAAEAKPRLSADAPAFSLTLRSLSASAVGVGLGAAAALYLYRARPWRRLIARL